MDKIRVIKLSMQCLRYGVLGLLPIIGLPFAVRALVCYRRARREAGGDWNPATRQLYSGHTLAVVGCGLTVLTLAVIVVAVINASR